MSTASSTAGPTGLEQLQALRDHGMPTGIGPFIGMEPEEVEDGRIVFSASARPEFANPIGSMHGGIAATLLDSAMGCAVHTTLPPATGYTSLDISVRYLRPGPLDGSKLRAEGRVIHRGRTIRTAEAELTDHQGRLLATATTTCLIVPLG
ncbi:PaaI family thioesterase [Embleya sp. AB8]|uniref:PaaI family thioesterase n=1 Tax=Embleya sp. AB8 TaxID=3156304 RepID=UPI003C71A17D